MRGKRLKMRRCEGESKTEGENVRRCERVKKTSLLFGSPSHLRTFTPSVYLEVK